MKINLAVGVGVVGAALGGWIWLAQFLPAEPHNPEAYSAGYVRPGQCMSGKEFNARSTEVVNHMNWSQVTGSAAASPGDKILVGAMIVMRDMARLETAACPDLDPIYQRYLETRNVASKK